MFTYTPACMPTFDYFSDQPWMMHPGHLDQLSPGAQEFFGIFKVCACQPHERTLRILCCDCAYVVVVAAGDAQDKFEQRWRERGADEQSRRLPASIQSRTAADYTYTPALKQFEVFMETMGVEAGVLARL